MKRITRRLVPLFLAAQCLFCYGETKDDITELYARRVARSQTQLPYISLRL